MQPTPYDCAREILETIPLTMQAIGGQMRANPPLNLSVHQFRTLMFLSRHEGASLSDAAGHLGLSLPSVSKLVDGLVARGVVARQPHPRDRRRVTLTLTANGRSTLQTVREAVQAHLARILVTLPPAQRATVMQAMRALRQVFAPEREEQAAGMEGRP